MDYDSIKEELLSDGKRLLDEAEILVERCKLLEENNRLLQLQLDMKSGGDAQWIEFDETDEKKRPLDGEFVVVQVADCKPFMLTYLKGCKVKINKWFRLPE